MKSKYDYAFDFYNQGKYQQTVSYCTEILDQGTKYKQFYVLRAKAYQAMGNYGDAEADYTEALMRARDPDLYVNRAMVCICAKEFEKAEIDLNEAIRLFTEHQPSYLKSNFFILEDRGRVYHYLGDYKSAIKDFKDALDNGSMMAYIELLSSLFSSQRFYDVKLYSDSILRNVSSVSILSDSSFYFYTSALNDISNNAPTEKSLSFTEHALSIYKNSDNRCFQGFYYDLLSLKAYIESHLGYDSLSYEDYKKIYAVNNQQPDIREKIDNLKIKLGIDATPPVITLINPQVNTNSFATMTTTKTKVEIYGNVFDSSGVASLQVNRIPCKVEEDGTFVSKVELQTGKNEIFIAAVDKYDNKIEKKFVIDVQSKEETNEDTAGIPELVSKANYHAILIGEDVYQDNKFPELNNPVKDAKELKEILQKNYLFDEANIKVLPNSKKTDIIDTITDICKNLTEDDNLLIFFAGHGAIRKDRNTVRGGYLVPSDAKSGSWSTYISSDDLREAIASGSAAKHILFLVDACYGGQLLRSVMDDASSQIKHAYMYKSRRFIASGNLEEVADKGEFIASLKENLKNNADKYLPAEKLYMAVKTNVTSTTPIYERINDAGDMGGDFIFIRR